MIARLTIAAVFIASLALAGCGKLGDLEQPAPMFGAQAKADYQAQHRAEDAARARAQAAKQPSPEQNGDTPDPNALPLNLSGAPKARTASVGEAATRAIIGAYEIDFRIMVS